MTKLLVYVTAFVVCACNGVTSDNFQNPPPGPPETCAPSSDVVGCNGSGVVGYTCGSDRPDDGDTNLVCDDGTALGSDAGTAYCCAPYAQYFSECSVDTSVPGCSDDDAGAEIGFSCSGMTAPAEADPELTCREVGGDAGARGAFCCASAK